MRGGENRVEDAKAADNKSLCRRRLRPGSRADHHVWRFESQAGYKRGAFENPKGSEGPPVTGLTTFDTARRFPAELWSNDRDDGALLAVLRPAACPGES